MDANQDRSFTLRFWGTRGSLPAPRPSTNKYGGNTPCLEVWVEDRVLIFDAGSGIRPLGAKLQRKAAKVRAHVFFTHYHWDHIHGFPFFYPAFAPGNHFVIHGQPHKGRNVKDILSGQMAGPYFPVPLDAMRARFDFKEVGPKQRLRVGPATVRTELLNHPGRALSYRIDYRGRSIVYASDTEHGNKLDQRLVNHCRGADILIYDACYTPEEYRKGRQGWGHSTWREGVRVAEAAGARRLLLFHHEPSRNDRALMGIERSARQLMRGAAAAREGRLYIP